MKASFLDITEKQRLIVLSRSILWGHEHFDSKLGLGVASNRIAYAIPNLRYGAALLEAVHDQREIELSAPEAVNRANTVIATVLRSSNGGFLRWVGSGAPNLPARLLANHVLPVLAFLDSHHEAMRLTGETEETVRESLFKLLRKLSEGASGSGSTPSEQDTVTRTSGPEADTRLLNEFTRKLPTDYHWSRSVGLSPGQIIQHGPCALWQFPRPTCELVEGQDICCVVNRYIETWFYKGDWKNPKPPTIPVVFVGGWQPFIQGSASPGFLCQSWWSIRPPQNAPHPEGHHPPMAPPTPPPLFELWIETEQNKSFDGLGLGLMKAGYDCVRFAQSAPDDDIMIAVDELKHVVDKTKELYGTDRVVLVCHSRGGLVARKYIVDRWKAERIIDVAKLITYGTPHLGAQLGEIGAEIITGVSLTAVFGPEIAGLVDSIGLIPGVGPQIKSEIQSQIIQLISQFAQPYWDGLADFFVSGAELTPSSAFITQLNSDYAAPVIPLGQHVANLWTAIDHVLIAGTTPNYFHLYLGSWLRTIDPVQIPEAIIEAVAPQFGTQSITLWDGVTIDVSFIYWDWNWHWFPILALFGDLARLIAQVSPEVATVLAFREGQGDFIVEKISALAEKVTGQIRRGEFHLHHFNLPYNDEVSTPWEYPANQWHHVNPLGLLLVELGVPIGTASTFPPPHSCP